jgi:hypothetical protein
MYKNSTKITKIPVVFTLDPRVKQAICQKAAELGEGWSMSKLVNQTLAEYLHVDLTQPSNKLPLIMLDDSVMEKMTIQRRDGGLTWEEIYSKWGGDDDEKRAHILAVTARYPELE